MAASPAESLDRMILPNGWVVVGRVQLIPGGTGSHFSVGYLVESSTSGQQAFLKALSFEEILSRATDKLRALQEALRVYNFEKDLCQRCQRMDRIVSIIDAGEVQTDPANALSIVPYLIFEAAPDGDVRAFVKASGVIDAAWALRTLHHAATGLQQMHGLDIAHQDLKPSNILVFGIELSKVADLGCASNLGTLGPRDGPQVAGAIAYAPPELLYGQVSPDFAERRFACDLYLLGSMLAFFFTGASMTALIMQHLQPAERPRALLGGWAGDYASALPLVQSAFSRALGDFGATVPTSLRDELVEMLRELCDPDPKRRGNPRARRRGGDPYAMPFFVSRFDSLATRSEARFKLKVP